MHIVFHVAVRAGLASAIKELHWAASGSVGRLAPSLLSQFFTGLLQYIIEMDLVCYWFLLNLD